LGAKKKRKNRWGWNGYWAAAKTLPESLSFCDPKPNAPTAIIATKTVAKCVGCVSTFCHRTPQNTAYTTHNQHLLALKASRPLMPTAGDINIKKCRGMRGRQWELRLLSLTNTRLEQAMRTIRTP